MKLPAIFNNRVLLRALEVMDRRQENRLSESGMLAQAFDFAKTNEMSGDYFEFGLWRAKTFSWARLMAERYQYRNITFRGFDSFEGLPAPTETQYNIWSQGHFACSLPEFESLLKKNGFRPGQYELTKGFFEQTLTPELSTRLVKQGVKASIIYIDCDLYESALCALWFVRPLLQDGTIVCFDDFFSYRGRPDMGEQRAFAEFQDAFPCHRWRPYLMFGPVGMSFLHYSTPAQTIG